MVQAEEVRVTQYQTWQQSWQNKVTACQQLNTQLVSLQSTVGTMDSLGTFLSMDTSSTNTDALTATSTGQAQTGTHTFSVLQVAQTEIMITSSGYASLTSNVNLTGAAASLVYNYRGVTVSNAIPASASLTDLVNIINSNPNNDGVQATTIFDGTNYYLQIRGLDQGANSTLTIASNSTLTGFGQGNFQVTQKNQDSHFKIDGWPLGSGYITRSNNSVSDVLQGITLNIAASGSGTIATSVNYSSVLANVQSFISQVNSVLTEIQNLTKVDPTSGQGSILTGNYSLEFIQEDMADIAGEGATGFDPNRDAFYSLADVGISVDASDGSATEGLLLLDSNAFMTALTNNPQAVGNLFSANLMGQVSSADISFGSAITSVTQGGIYNFNYTVSGGKIVGATINGDPAIFHSNSSYITGQNGFNEAGLLIQVNNLTNGTYSHNVYLKNGKLVDLSSQLTQLTDSTNGPLAVIETNYDSIISDIQTTIDDQQTRIQQMATNLQNEFSKLDALLGTYSQMQTSLTNEASQLTGYSSTSSSSG
jgi:flagellar hook-associated protein 2